MVQAYSRSCATMSAAAGMYSTPSMHAGRWQLSCPQPVSIRSSGWAAVKRMTSGESVTVPSAGALMLSCGAIFSSAALRSLAAYARHASSTPVRAMPMMSGRIFRRSDSDILRRGGQPHSDSGSLAELAFRSDLAGHAVDQMLYNRQTETGPTHLARAGRVHAKEPLEYARQRF